MKMLPRRGIGRGRPEQNVVLIEEVQSLRARMETIETVQRRAPDEGDKSSSEESVAEEVDEDNETTKVIKMLVRPSEMACDVKTLVVSLLLFHY